MDYIIICAVALVVAGLTLFSGFGLGTLLMPAFALFFPLEMAIAATAVVHLANNIFKAMLVGRGARMKIVLAFALPAAACAALGAWLLSSISHVHVLVSYAIGGRTCDVTAVKLVIAVLIFVFALVELIPHDKRTPLDMRLVPLGGALSGFFGGLSGHQGALRTAVLIRLGLPKDAFIGTMVVSAVVVDVFRIAVYGITFVSKDIAVMREQGAAGLVMAGIVAAFLGSFIGKRLLTKVTMRTVQLIVGALLIMFSLALGTGVI